MRDRYGKMYHVRLLGIPGVEYGRLLIQPTQVSNRTICTGKFDMSYLSWLETVLRSIFSVLRPNFVGNESHMYLVCSKEVYFVLSLLIGKFLLHFPATAPLHKSTLLPFVRHFHHNPISISYHNIPEVHSKTFLSHSCSHFSYRKIRSSVSRSTTGDQHVSSSRSRSSSRPSLPSRLERAWVSFIGTLHMSTAANVH